MISKTIKKKGLLSRLIEQGIRILLIKECKKISNIKIEIISNSYKILQGEIQKINIYAKDIEYKDLLFDEVELEANHLKINFEIKKKKLYFKNEPTVKFKISLSQTSLSKVLSSGNWNSIEALICKEIVNKDKLEYIKIKNDQFFICASEENNIINESDLVEIDTDKGKVYLRNRAHTKTIQIPFEEKIYIEKVNIENNLINFIGYSSISF